MKILNNIFYIACLAILIPAAIMYPGWIANSALTESPIAVVGTAVAVYGGLSAVIVMFIKEKQKWK